MNYIFDWTRMSEQLKTLAFMAGVASVGLLYYLGWQRRIAPEFHERRRAVYEKRQVAALFKLRVVENDNADIPRDPDAGRLLPRDPDQDDILDYIYKQLNLAEEAFLTNEDAIGARHLATAFVLSGEDAGLMDAVRRDLPSDAFQLTLQNLPAARAAVEKMIYSVPGSVPPNFP